MDSVPQRNSFTYALGYMYRVHVMGSVSQPDSFARVGPRNRLTECICRMLGSSNATTGCVFQQRRKVECAWSTCRQTTLNLITQQSPPLSMRHRIRLDKWPLLALYLEEQWSAVRFPWRSQQPATRTQVTALITLRDIPVLHADAKTYGRREASV